MDSQGYYRLVRGHKKFYSPFFLTYLGAIPDVSNFSYVDVNVYPQTCELNANVMFVESRKLDDNVMRRVTDMNEADILFGHTKAILAKHYVMYELDKPTHCNMQA